MRNIVKVLSLLLALCAFSRVTHADAVLSGSLENHFPTSVDLDVEVRAQVEMSTYLFDFGVLQAAGDYVLTVPGPKGAYVVGVDMDIGSGYVQTAMVGEAPPPSLGGSSVAQDPEVAAWLGTEPLRADLSDLEGGPLKVRVRFQRVLRRYQGKVDFQVGTQRAPLRASSDPGPSVTGKLRLRTSRTLSQLEVAGASVQVDQGSFGASIDWQGEGDALLDLHYQEASANIDLHFFAHRTPSADPLGGDEGYFMLIIDADDASLDTAQRRTLSMVIDESGSMQGGKIEQAKEAARAMLEHLGSGDEFNLITFDDSVRAFRASPVAATADNIELARDFIKAVRASGGTDLDQGIEDGLLGIEADDSARFDAMILLSDGMATSGETSPARIHDNAISNNLAKARMFTFSVGSGADRTLMEALARSSRGRHTDLNDAQATQEMLLRVNELFEDIRVVRLTDLEIEPQNLATSDVLPEQMHDLFSGGQAILVGRYQAPASGQSSVRLTGDDNGAAFLRSISIDAPALESDNGFIKYVWATEKVGSLLAQMGAGGNSDALREEIVEIGLAYRIQTPYTSFTTPPEGGGGGGGSGSGGSGGGWGSGGELPGPSQPLLQSLLALSLLALSVLLWRRRRQ